MLHKPILLVLTGGGLAPALNPTLYGVISEAQKQKMTVLGGMFGWQCLLRNGRVVDLSNYTIEALKDQGGNLLRSSRTNPFKVDDGLEQIKERIKALGIDYVIAIGGDDTLGAARQLVENHHLQIVGIPKTVDNDLSGTYFTPGYPTAADCFARLVKEIKEDAAYATSRIYVIESTGMKAGWQAASSCYGMADIIFLPEKEIKFDRALELLQKRYEDNGDFAVVATSQYAKFDRPIKGRKDDQTETFGHERQEFICAALKDAIKTELGIDTKMIFPYNFLQTGFPIAIDRKMGIALGKKAIELVREKKFGWMSTIVRPDPRVTKLTVSAIHLDEVVGADKLRLMDERYFDFENFQVKQKFLDYLEPMLGKFLQPDSDYYQLIRRVNSQETLL